MIGLAAVRARGTTLLDVHNVGARGLMFRFHKIIDRIAKRFGTDVALRWSQALIRHQGTINESQLISAIASGNLQVVESVVNAHALQLTVEKALRDPLLKAMQAGGTASMQLLNANGIAASFNAIHANVILYAQTKAAQLVTSVPEDIRETIRLVVSLGATGRLTVQAQARMIKEVIGLPRNWALAPLHFGDELRQIMKDGTREYGTFTRRLSAVDMSMIRRRIEAGTLTPAFINDMEAVYAQRLIALRAETIARTESLAAANFGVQEQWRQSVREGDLPTDVKQFWIVTPDDRLCPICSEIPGMNPDGVGVDESFDTPEGPVDGPPAPHPNCRCSVGLVLPGATGDENAPVDEEAPPAPPPEETPAPETPPSAEPPLEGADASAYLNRTYGGAESPAPAGVLYSPEQKLALGDYQGHTYDRINRSLRQADDVSQAVAEWAAPQVAIIDSAIAATPALDQSVVVWRGGKFASAPQVGSTILDKGFPSTSTSSQVAATFARDIYPQDQAFLMRIEVPEGTKALWMPSVFPTLFSEREKELLLSRSSQFVVTEIRRETVINREFQTIYLRLLP